VTDKNFAREIITSRQNPTVKRICSLLEKKSRRREGLFRFDGIKLLCEAAKKGLDIELIAVSEAITDGVFEKISSLIKSRDIDESKIVYVSEQIFDKMSEESSPEGVITVARFIDKKHREISSACDYTVAREKRILLAESLRDPGNLGTVIRSCYALGIDTLLLTDDCADIYNPKTIRAAMGAAFRLNTQTVALDRLPSVIKSLRESGRRVFAAALCEDSLDISTLELRSGDCFVIGNEGHGLSESTVSACDASVIIPMRADAESLNAAAAAAICIWETVRS
jgi:TrmH family RNA methyltransferase